MVRLLIFITLFFCGLVHAAGYFNSILNSSEPDVIVYFVQRGKGVRYACFGSCPVYRDGNCVRLRKALSEQMLAGYCFLPDIVLDGTEEECMRPGVREGVCSTMPFFSEEIKQYWMQIKKCLIKSKYVKRLCLPHHEEYEQLFISDSRLIYPDGKTRLWHIIPNQLPRCDEEGFYIFLSDHVHGLKGVLSEEEEWTLPPESLLAIKQNKGTLV